MKIVFFGTPDFAVESLRAILDNGYDVAAVVTATDKPAGRGHKMQCSAVKKFAIDRGLNVLQPERLKDDAFINKLQEINADVFVVIAFRMLPEAVWKMPPLGTFNLHASLLPKYRGAAPINHAVINGETQTGVTTFFLQQEIDTGDIIDRVSIEIHPDDNVGQVHDRLMKLGAELTVKTIKNIELGTLVTTPQNLLLSQGEKNTPAPKIFKETGHIDWNKPANVIHNLIRGLSPYPGAWSVLTSTTMAPIETKIFRSEITERKSTELPGKILIENDRLFVNTFTNLLEIKELQLSGKKRMPVDAFLRGARLVDSKFSNNNF